MKYLVCLTAMLLGCSGSGDDGSGVGTSVTIRAPRAPDAVIAYRDGDGAWSTKRGTDAPFSFSVASGAYTVAIACPGKSMVRAYRSTPGELGVVEYAEECRPTVTTLTAYFTGNTTDGNRVQWGVLGSAASSSNALTMPVPLGKNDLLATRGNAFAADRLVIMRDFEVASETAAPVDFEGPSAVVLESRSISVSEPVTSTFVSSGGTAITLSATDFTERLVPEAQMAPGDLHAFLVSARTRVDAPTFAGALYMARTPPEMLNPVQAVGDAPVMSEASVSVTWNAPPDATLYQLTVSGDRSKWVISISPDVFADAGALEMPDVSAPGWDASLGLTSGGLNWQVQYFSGMEPAQILRPFPSVEGRIGYAGWVE